ncbi:glycosyltransferase family 2 protein [Bradyrhizobium sp. 200]|uniref:glycosyltransferase family 2 protein n=1 Tax=Bradyrhizobium sp. 200 TaxID=2782665 RepID=UPI001FFED572|nr:glycosyltransferase family 2 protein [Bradyrhizobium sp. 200]UPJ51725.1 glycosyltransferase family 2 protein [Bradyrhizobium sp. 200]
MNKPQIDFSIIVPVFNRKSYLEAAIHSISRQTYESYEVIVIDDGSTDDTAEFVESLGGPISKIRQANSGVSKARNHGAEIARGKYLVFLDSDDVLLPWSLQCYSDVISRFQPLVISARTIEFKDEPPTLEEVVYQKPLVRVYDDYLANAEIYSFVGASCIIIEADVFARSNGFANEMNAGEDYDLLLRVGVERPYAKIEAPATVGYRVHADNVSKKVDRLVEGSSNLLARESEGIYPGGRERAFDRITVIGRVVRPVILASLQRGRLEDAWRLYRKSFWMHVRTMRIRFLVAAAVLILCSFLKEATKFFSKSRAAVE